VQPKEKGSKKPKTPKKIKEPTIDSGFLLFFINLMAIKKLIFRYGYGAYWKKWSLIELCDTAFMLLVKGYTIG